jgi:branched-chain amino acid transport system ATP-binding protein
VTTLLELRGVRAGYGAIEVLHDVSFSVAAGEILAILGANGAGKSTALAVASGTLTPTEGHVLVGGLDVTGTAPGALARAGLCTIPEGRAVFPNLTVQENIRMMSHRGVATGVVEERTFARFPGLAQRRRQRAGDLSGGEQQMLGLARAIATDPAVVLVDEMSMGLAPLVVAELFRVLEQIAEDGVAVVVVEQLADAALDVATHAVVLAHGRVARAGPPDEIRDVVAETYLGVAP